MTNEHQRPVSPESIAQVRGWTCCHFTICDSEADVPRLMRKVADELDELGDIRILDVTFCLQTEGPGPTFEAEMSVYLAFPEDEEPHE